MRAIITLVLLSFFLGMFYFSTEHDALQSKWLRHEYCMECNCAPHQHFSKPLSKEQALLLFGAPARVTRHELISSRHNGLVVGTLGPALEPGTTRPWQVEQWDYTEGSVRLSFVRNGCIPPDGCAHRIWKQIHPKQSNR